MATILDNLKQLSSTISYTILDYLKLFYLRLSQSTILDNPSQLSHTIKYYLRIYETFIPEFLRQLSKTSYQSIRLSKTTVLFMTFIVTKHYTTIEQNNNNINYKSISKQLGFDLIVISLVQNILWAHKIGSSFKQKKNKLQRKGQI